MATRKFDPPMHIADSQLYLESVLEPLCEVYPSYSLFRHALDLSGSSGFSFYDSLIVAGAIECGSDVLLTEDMQGGREVEGVTIRNPFTAGSTLLA